jgi:hypothetical protein
VERETTQGALDEIMSGSTDKNLAEKLLRGLEDGRMNTSETALLAQDLDPVLVYVILRYLREVYPASNPAASGVLDRVVGLTSSSPKVVALSKEGEQDPVSQWFSSEYNFPDFRGRGSEMLDLIVDKLES